LILGWNDQHEKTGANMSRALRRCFGFTVFLAFLISWVAIRVTAQIIGPVGQDPSAAGVAGLRDIIDSAVLSDLRWPDFSPYRSEVARFYASDGYSLAWIHRGRPRPQAFALTQILGDADRKGLSAEDYDGPRWPARLASLRASASELDLVRFDVALTVSAMRYIRAVHFGRANPKVFKFELDVENTKYDLADFLRALAVSSSDLTTLLRRLEPNFPEYDRLLACLPQYLQLAKQDPGERLRSSSKPLVPGETYASLPQLAHLLRLLGDLPAAARVSPDSTIFEGSLVDAVKHYQARLGDAPDGRLDARTIAELNVPLSARVRQIRLALERWRWVSHTFSQPPIVINLPEFWLRGTDESGKVTAMTVTVETDYALESPVFEGELKYVVFRPYWQVAPSIEQQEIIPHIKRDQGFLPRNRFEIVASDGTVITDGPVSDALIEQLKAGRLHVRQKPGPKNPIGLVKLSFSNSENVYLHGADETRSTPDAPHRLTHGCIRVQEAAGLAAWVLRNNPGWDLDRVRAFMNGMRANVQVNPSTTISVLIVYGTAAVDEDGQIHFSKDIYGFDAKLQRALEREKHLTSRVTQRQFRGESSR
jgi:L,D-transpeptidase YcbB